MWFSSGLSITVVMVEVLTNHPYCMYTHLIYYWVLTKVFHSYSSSSLCRWKIRTEAPRIIATLMDFVNSESIIYFLEAGEQSFYQLYTADDHYTFADSCWLLSDNGLKIWNSFCGFLQCPKIGESYRWWGIENLFLLFILDFFLCYEFMAKLPLD